MRGRTVGWLIIIGIVLGVVLAARKSDRAEWGQGLDDPNPAFRAAAIRQSPTIATERLVNLLLHDESPDIRILAASRLYGPALSPDEMEALVRALKDPHAGVRREAAWSLGSIGPGVWPFLREAMRDENAHCRAGAVHALTSTWRDKEEPAWVLAQANEILPVIRELTGDNDPEVRGKADELLRRFSRSLERPLR